METKTLEIVLALYQKLKGKEEYNTLMSLFSTDVEKADKILNNFMIEHKEELVSETAEKLFTQKQNE